MSDTSDHDRPARLPTAFPRLVEGTIYALSRNPDRDLHILHRRFGLDGGSSSTLEELGACHDITRERVRQIQVQSLNRILEVLSGSKYSKKFEPAVALRHDFEKLQGELQQAPAVLTRREFEALIEDRCESVVEGDWFGLFATLLGMKRLAPSSQVQCPGLGELWCACDLISDRDVDVLFEYLNGVREQVATLRLPRMMADLKAILRDGIDLASLRIILGNLESLEVTGDEVRARTNWLKYCNDQLIRVLQDADEPLSRDEIVRRFNVIRVGQCNGKPLRAEDIGNRLSGDERFVHAGKSGVWALAAWDRLREMTIVEAMEHALHSAGHPMTVPELLEQTRKLRPGVAANSVVTYSGQEERFVRVSDGRVALAGWKLSDCKPKRHLQRLNPDDFLAAVEIVRNGRDELPLSELVAELVDLLGKAEPTIRQHLAKIEGLEIQTVPGARGKVARFEGGKDVSIKASSKPLKREKIQREIRRFLKQSPEAFEKKADLWEKVNERFACKKSTFYRYLSEMNIDTPMTDR